MVKLIALLKRKDGVSAEEFSRYWHDEHGPLIASSFPKIRRYVQNHAVKLEGGGEPKVDGVVELWFDDLQTWKEFADMYRSEKGKVIADDEEKFIDRSKMVFFVTEEKVIVP